MTAPRVLFVNPGRALGGAERSLLLLLRGLQARQVETVVALFGRGPLEGALSAMGVETAIVEPSRRVMRVGRYSRARSLAGVGAAVAALPAALRLASVARRVGAGVIHTNGMKAHLLGGLAGRLIGLPVVWHVRDFPPPGLAGRIFREAARRFPTLVLANSEAVARAVRRPAPSGAPVLTLYNPVDLERFRPDLGGDRIRRELGIAEDAPLVGMVAHLTPWKGHSLFLDVARIVAGKLPRARFVVVGGSIYESDGHAGYAEALRQRAIALDLPRPVSFLGERDDIPDVLAGLDVLVHCPVAPEPFGRVLAEAMAVGRPVVAAGSGGIPEVIEDRVTGLLVASSSALDFASAVVALLEDPALRDRLGRAGRRRAEALFGVDAHVAGVLETYRTVVARRRSVTTGLWQSRKALHER